MILFKLISILKDEINLHRSSLKELVRIKPNARGLPWPRIIASWPLRRLFLRGDGEFPLTVVSENDFWTGWTFTQGQHLCMHAEMLWHWGVGFCVGVQLDSGGWGPRVKGWHDILENSWYFWRWQRCWSSWIQGFHPHRARWTNEPRSHLAQGILVHLLFHFLNPVDLRLYKVDQALSF